MRHFKVLMALCMAIALTCPTVFAAEAELTELNDRTEIEAVTESYLNSCTEGIYFHSGEMDSSQTLTAVMMDTLTAEETSMEESISVAALDDFVEESSPTLLESMDRSSIFMKDMVMDLSTMENRTAYFGHVYEEQDITYSYFNADYVFNAVKVEGDYALAEVNEILDYQYSFCDEPTYEMIQYNVLLMKLNGEWVIADVISDDQFFQANYDNADYDLETAIDGYDEVTDTAYIAENGLDDQSVTVTAANGSGDISYIKENAVNYALMHTTSDDSGTPSFKNDRFPWFGADCMNFASQCIWAGFGGSNSTTDIANGNGMDKVGSNSGNTAWWANNTSGTNSWASCRNFRLYVTNSAGSADKGLLCDMIPTAYNSNTLAFSAEDLIGAILHVQGSSNGSPVAGGHAVFVNNATGNTRDKIYVCAYNNCAKNKLLSTGWPASSTETTKGITAIVPRTFQGGEEGTRLWADLHNVFVDKTATRTLNGYSNVTLASLQMVVYRPNGTPVMDWTVYNTDHISTTYNEFNISGEWSIKLIGVDVDGDTTTWWHTIRVK